MPISRPSAAARMRAWSVALIGSGPVSGYARPSWPSSSKTVPAAAAMSAESMAAVRTWAYAAKTLVTAISIA
jgi:hypothetical protein